MGTNYVKKQRTIRLPAISDLQINSFDTGVISSRGSYIRNGTVLKYPDGSLYVTQRPSFAAFNSPSDVGETDARGRGIHYWAGHNIADLYFVNNDTVYKGTYSNPLAQTISEGNKKVHTAELGDDLVFVDTENNQTWYVDADNPTTLVSMNDDTDPNFDALPQNNGRELASGVVVLDNTMYVLATDGTVWGSALGNAEDWSNAVNVITAEKEHDAGVFIEKHYDHIAVFGRRTIEFFYDAANAAPASPLSVRQDISYNIGCACPCSVWRNGDDIYFLGIDTSGQIQPYLLREYKLTPLATSSIISYITTSKSLEGTDTIGAGMSTGGITYYVLSTYVEDGNNNIQTNTTYVYNTTTNIWTEWEFGGSTINNFPLVNYTITDDSRIGEGIMADGTLVYATDNYVPVDSEFAPYVGPYVETDYVATDYVVESGGTGVDSAVINMLVRLDNFDNDNRDWKFAHQLRFVGDETVDSHLLNIRWSDGNNLPSQYTGNRTIDVKDNKNKLTRLGRFKSRSFEFEYTGTEQIRFKGVDLDITEGTH